MAANEKSEMFFVNCIVVFLDLTKPASSMQKPQAINITKKPPIKNNKELKTKILCSGTPCANVGLPIDTIKVVKSSILRAIDNLKYRIYFL